MEERNTEELRRREESQGISGWYEKSYKNVIHKMYMKVAYHLWNQRYG